MGSLSDWATQATGRDMDELAKQAPPVVFDTSGGWKIDGAAYRRGLAEAEFAKSLPTRFRNADADDARVLTWIDRHIENPEGNSHLLLMGNTGSGKTTQLVGTIRRLVLSRTDAGQTPPSFLYTTHAEAAAKMRDFRNDGADQFLTKLCTVDILALDELGSVLGRDWGMEWLSSVVDTRYRECRPLLVATNKPAAELAATLKDDRIISRLAEGRSTIIMVRDDLRMQQREVIE